MPMTIRTIDNAIVAIRFYPRDFADRDQLDPCSSMKCEVGDCLLKICRVDRALMQPSRGDVQLRKLCDRIHGAFMFDGTNMEALRSRGQHISQIPSVQLSNRTGKHSTVVKSTLHTVNANSR